MFRPPDDPYYSTQHRPLSHRHSVTSPLSQPLPCSSSVNSGPPLARSRTTSPYLAHHQSPYSSSTQRTPSVSRGTAYLASLGPSSVVLPPDSTPAPPPSPYPANSQYYNNSLLPLAGPSRSASEGRRTSSGGTMSGGKGKAHSTAWQNKLASAYAPAQRVEQSSSSSTRTNGSAGVGGGRKLVKPRPASSAGVSSSYTSTASLPPPSPSFAPTSASRPSFSPYPPVPQPPTFRSPAPSPGQIYDPTFPMQSPSSLLSPGLSHSASFRSNSSSHTSSAPSSVPSIPYVPASTPPIAGSCRPPQPLDRSTTQQRQDTNEAATLARALTASYRSAADYAEAQRLISVANQQAEAEALRADATVRDQERRQTLENEQQLREVMAKSREEEEWEKKEREREEEEMRRVMELSRKGRKGKGRGDEQGWEEGGEEGGVVSEETEWDRREREAVEMAMQLSIEEEERGFSRYGNGNGFGGRAQHYPSHHSTLPTTSSQPRPPLHETVSAPAAIFSAPFTSTSTFQHPLFSNPTASPPLADPSSQRRLSFDEPDEPPPSYEYAAHTAEMDREGDVVLGPPLTAGSSALPLPGAASPERSLHHVPNLQQHFSPSFPSTSTSSSPALSLTASPSLSRPSSSRASSPLPPLPPRPSYLPTPSRRLSLAPSIATTTGTGGVAPSFLADAGSFYEGESRSGSGSERSFEVGREEGEGWRVEPEEMSEEEGDDPFGDSYSVVSNDGAAGSDGEEEYVEEGEQEEAREEAELAEEGPHPERQRDLFGTAWPASKRMSQAEGGTVIRAGTARSRSGLVVVLEPSSLEGGFDGETPSTSTLSPVSPAATTSTVTSGGSRSSSTSESTPTGTTSTALPSRSPSLLSPPQTSIPSFTSSSNSTPSSPVNPSPSPTASISSRSFNLHSTPSRGGLVDDFSSPAAPFAEAYLLKGMKYGFVDPRRAVMHPSLEFEGDFQRGAQMSFWKDEGGRERYGAFAIEAGSWESLLVYLMWHGNSRFEASPSDLQRDKLNRGLRASLSVDFFRSTTDDQPRVRALLTLLPLSPSSAPPPYPSRSASLDTADLRPVDSPTYDAECPSIRLSLSTPLSLPLPLSLLATTLSRTHTISRASLGLLRRGLIGASALSSAGSSAGATQLLIERAALARSVDLLRTMNGEIVEDEVDGAGEGGGLARERGMMERLKKRLIRAGAEIGVGRGRGPRVIQSSGGGVGGSGRHGRGEEEGGGALPEGALLITPFSLD